MTALVPVPLTPELVHGALDLERTERGLRPHRLPGWAREQNTDPQVAMVEVEPAGVRLVLRTAAAALELDTLPTRREYAGVPPRPLGLYDVLVDGRLVAQDTVAGGDRLVLDPRTGTAEQHRGEPGTLRVDLPAGEKRVEVWLPHLESTELVALRADAPVQPVERSGPRWLHHGSSISQGSNATSPTSTWTSVAAAAAGVDLTNLGLGGSALLDPFVARTLRDHPADLVSVKLGINVVNADAMRMRAFVPAVHGFLDTIREGHPDVPLLVTTPLYCPIHEDTPGPGGFDLSDGTLRFVATGDPAEVAAGRLSLRTIRGALTDVVEQRRASDPHLHLVDGLTLYGPADHDELPLPDRLHLDTAGHRRVGERFAEVLREHVA
ncbi:GDSL-type esterase/lipase family protein [Aeromicrobium massiliense]|uniref:GDSL-type esterase/lipase family protein n=1 Tax=Aeromicrobium massiliense TaxID=1464554 RepID=UPI000578818E|nr:GDSL-type esterase/lipase family protein [Aeromicrobium massiliense]